MKNPLLRIFFGEKFKNLFIFPLVLIPNILGALFEGLSFGLIVMAFTILNGEVKNSLESIPFSQYLPFINSPEGASQHHLFLVVIVAAIALQIVRSTMTFLGENSMLFLTLKIQREMQSKVYEQIMRFSFSCVSRYKVGDLVEYARAPSLAISLVMEALNRSVTSVFMIIASMIVMWLLSPKLTLITLLLFAVFASCQKMLIKRILRTSKFLADEMSDLSKHTVQNLYGIRAVFTFNRQDNVLKKTANILEKIAQTTKKVRMWNQFITSINEVTGMILVGTSLVIGSFLLTANQTSMLPILLTFITVSYRLSTRIQTAMSNFGTMATYMGSIFRVKEILLNEDKEFSQKGGLVFSGLKKGISFENIHLLYSGSRRYAISNLSLTISKGHRIAFVGASGAGKSSILDLLLRLYDPTAGSILVDGVDLRVYDPVSWREALGVVSQDTFIFNETIEDNIRFGDVAVSTEQVQEAAKRAGAHDFIVHLPNGYNTLVGERGYRLSGGEKQRLALARALLRDPEILILDEATSNLDSHSETIIQKSINQFQENRTVIVVAHRLSTIINADQIYVLDKGTIIEQGIHSELLKKNGRYTYLWHLQSDQFTNENPNYLDNHIINLAHS